MRVLIATVTAGGGHLAAAAALEEAWRAARPSDTLQKVDVLDFASKFYRKLYVDTYVKLVEHVPELYAMVFKKTDDHEKVRKANSFRRSFAHHTNKGFAKFLKQTRADLVLCPHYLPLEIIGHSKSKSDGVHPFTVCIVTDFEAHAFWLEPSVDFYCVAAEETKGSLISRGVASSQIAVTGIPIASKFSEKLSTLEIRKKYGLRDDMPMLLVLSGGFGMGPVAEILEQLDKVQGHFHTVVVAGRNEELRQSVAAQDRAHPTVVLGFTKNMHELMSVTDLIISKPGGLTSSEALAIGKPLLILNPIPGQEAANSDFLLEHGAAIKINRVEDLPYRLEQLLESKKLSEMSRAAKALGHPRAAHEVCAAVSDAWEKRDKAGATERPRVQRVEPVAARSRFKLF